MTSACAWGCELFLLVANTLLIYQSYSMSGSTEGKKNEVLRVVALCWQHLPSGRYLLARRKEGSRGAGEWEFPGGKVESGESDERALVREIEEELGFTLDQGRLHFLGKHTHPYPQRLIEINLWGYSSAELPVLQLTDHDRADWFSRVEIESLRLSEGDKSFISLLKN